MTVASRPKVCILSKFCRKNTLYSFAGSKARLVHAELFVASNQLHFYYSARRSPDASVFVVKDAFLQFFKVGIVALVLVTKFVSHSELPHSRRTSTITAK
jgi:hypothetical protein